jgi:uncharacterized repeat protein (TIGR01451 family)
MFPPACLRASRSLHSIEVLESRIAPASVVGLSEGGVGGDEVQAASLIDDETTVTLAVAPAAVTEDGSADLVYTFTRTGDVTEPLTVSFLVGGSANLDSDYSQTGALTYSSTAGSIVIPAGANSATLTIDPIVDSLPEPDETVTVTLASGAGYQPVVNTAIGTITSDDSLVTVVASVDKVSERTPGFSTALTFTFRRTGSIQSPITLNYSLSGTATLNVDYSPHNFGGSLGVITIPGGASVAHIQFASRDDTIPEDNETIVVTVGESPGYQVEEPGFATATIFDDDTVVSLNLTNVSVPEGDSTGLVYTVTRSPSGPQTATPVTFNLTGTAGWNTDYYVVGAEMLNDTMGTVVFPAGAPSVEISLIPVDDTLVEIDESVRLTLTSGLGSSYILGTVSSAMGTFLENDTATVEFASATSILEEGGQRQAVDVSLVITANGVRGVGSLTREVSALLRDLGSGTAGEGDYTFVGPTTISFPSGASSSVQRVFIDVQEDSDQEGDETINLQLSSIFEPTGQVNLGVQRTHIATIDDEAIELEITASQSSPTVVAGSGTANLVYTVTVTNPGLIDALNVVVDEDLTLIAGASIASITPGVGAYAPTVGDDGRWTIGQLPAGESATLAVVITVGSAAASGTSITSRSIVSADSEVLDFALIGTPVQRVMDLRVVGSASAGTAIPGGLIVYTFDVSNLESSDATGVILTEKLPAGTTFDPAASSAGWVGTGPGTFALQLGRVAGGATLEPITIAARVISPAVSGQEAVQNSVSIADDGTAGLDPTPGNNTDSSSTPLIAAPDLSVVTSASRQSIRLGELLTYTIEYGNGGNQDATGVFLTETLPASVTFTAAGSSSGWIETTPGSGLYRFDVGELGAGDSGSVMFQVQVSNSVSGGAAIVSNSASISDDLANGADPNSGNNSDSVDTPIYQGIFAVSLSASSPQVKAYDAATGTLALDFMAYEAKPKPSAGVSVAIGDMNGDGYDDIVTSYSRDTGRIRIFDGLTGGPLTLGGLTELNPFNAAADNGALVAVGDVTGDGRNDIVVSSENARQVKVYDGVTGELAAKFVPFGAAVIGTRVSVGDMNGDGVADIIAAQATGGGGVRAFAGGSLPATGAPELLFKTRLKGSDGVFVAAGNVSGDDRQELIMGSGDLSVSKLAVFSPESGAVLYKTKVSSLLGSSGLRVAAVDRDLDGVAEIIVAPGGRGAGEVLFLDGGSGGVLGDYTFVPFASASGVALSLAGSVPRAFV